MGFFDFLSAPKQDTPGVKKKQGAMPAGTVEEYPKGELPMNTDELWSYEAKEKTTSAPTEQKVSPDASGGMDRYRASESDLVKREGRAIRQVGQVLSTEYARNDPDVRRVVDAIERGTLSGSALAEDLGVLLKKKDLVIEGRGMGVDTGLHRLSALRNELSAVAEEKAKLEAGGMPRPSKAQAIPYQELEMEAEQAFKKAEVARLEASQSGALSRDKKLKEAENWKAQAAALQQQAMDAKGQDGAKAAPSPTNVPTALDGDIKKNLAGGGRTEESFRLAIVGGLKAAEKGAGLELGDLNTEVPYGVAMRTLLPILDPSGKVQSEFMSLVMKQKDTGQAQQGGQDPAKPSPQESDATLSELKAKQAERRELFQSLGRDPSSQNWLSAIVTILLSAAIGSERALRVMGYASRTNSLKYQLDILNQEINEDISLLRDQRQNERMMKQEAARRLQRTQDESDTWRRQVGMALMNHKLIIERNAKKGNPETGLMKKLSAEFSRSMGFASKYSKTKDDQMVPAAERQDAKDKFDAFMRRAAQIDEQLNDIGGDVLDEESEE